MAFHTRSAELGVPFHLLILLSSEFSNAKVSNPEAIQRLALELAGLLFKKDDDGTGTVYDKTPKYCASRSFFVLHEALDVLMTSSSLQNLPKASTSHLN